jgi:hypothetical protein
VGALERVRLGTLFLICAAAIALVPLLPSYLPLVDLPQHVALHAIWNHIDDPAFNLGGRFNVSLATPYALPHLAAHAAARFLGPEGGLRLVLILSLIAFPLAALALLRAFQRPAEIALAAFPASLSFVYWYGFISYVMALPLILLGIALSRRCAALGRPRDALLLAGLGLIAVATHGFAFMVLAFLAGIAALATTRAISRLALIAAALCPGLLWSLIWAARSASAVSAEPLPTTWGFASDRMRFGLATIFGMHTLASRVWMVAAGVLCVLGVALWRARASGEAGPASGRRALGMVALAAIAAALLCPEVFMNTWGLWERIPPVAFVAVAGAVPWPVAPRARRWLATGLTAIAVFASATALRDGLVFSRQAGGIRELAMQIPRGSRVMWSACGEERPWRRATPSFKHVGAYLQAERGGDLSYSFAHFQHMVVRYSGDPLSGRFDRSVYDFAVLRLGPRCPSLEELRKLGPVAIQGEYLAFPASAVTPELAAALEPERLLSERHSERAQP